MLTELDRVEDALAAVADPRQQAEVAARLTRMLRRLDDARSDADDGGPGDLEAATDEELFDMLNDELTGLGPHDVSPERDS